MLQQATKEKRGRPPGARDRCFMPGTHFKTLAPLLAQVLPPDTTGETLGYLCAQVALWMYQSTTPNKEAGLIQELKSMGVSLTPGGPGSLGTFKVEIDHG